jgi:hypothetical protein
MNINALARSLACCFFRSPMGAMADLKDSVHQVRADPWCPHVRFVKGVLLSLVYPTSFLGRAEYGCGSFIITPPYGRGCIPFMRDGASGFPVRGMLPSRISTKTHGLSHRRLYSRPLHTARRSKRQSG